MTFAGICIEIEKIMLNKVTWTHKDKHKMFFLIWRFSSKSWDVSVVLTPHQLQFSLQHTEEIKDNCSQSKCRVVEPGLNGFLYGINSAQGSLHRRGWKYSKSERKGEFGVTMHHRNIKSCTQRTSTCLPKHELNKDHNRYANLGQRKTMWPPAYTKNHRQAKNYKNGKIIPPTKGRISNSQPVFK